MSSMQPKIIECGKNTGTKESIDFNIPTRERVGHFYQ